MVAERPSVGDNVGMESSDATPDADQQKLATLATFNGEIAAEMLAAELRNAGIPAQASGTLTAGFRAEAPGSVQVLVHEPRLEEARRFMDDYLQSKEDIDWDQVDVGEPESPEA